MLSTSAKSIRILLSGPPRGKPRISFTAACRGRKSYIKNVCFFYSNAGFSFLSES
jgi:hypothetical protein